MTALSLASFLALAAVAAHGQFFPLDYRARGLVQLTHHSWLDSTMREVSHLGDNSGLVPLIALGMLFLWRANRRWALVLPLLMAGTGGLQLVSKWAVNRARPDLTPWGFPSGHVLSLVVFFGLMTYLLCGSETGRRWRCVGSGGCVVTVLAVAFSRLYLEAHWVSDLMGGFTLGLAYLLLTIWIIDAVIPGAVSGAASLPDPVET